MPPPLFLELGQLATTIALVFLIAGAAVCLLLIAFLFSLLFLDVIKDIKRDIDSVRRKK